MTRSVHAIDPDSPPDRKTTLFCPACDHQSPIDGDWVVREHTSSIEYRCPDCEALLTERKRESGHEHEHDHDRAPLVRAWSAWVRAASAWFRRPKRLRLRA
ncbi:hypothetical protein [Halalkalicoccus tibetensis]|uniref:C2H2-type domain-containing protein n=1 Tax=Halalkalicoccus tibetensis TaxID=175632 RepID=A0ABD5V3K0_9EURY